MGSKHGQWFPLGSHLSIHKNVIESFADWLIKSGDKKYNIKNFVGGDGVRYISHQIKFITTNGFLVEIKKKTKLSSEKTPKYGLTFSFSYNCFDLNKKPVLQYHSAHSPVFNPLTPWHHKPHRHEYVRQVQKVDVYSFDDRPKDQKRSKYTWGENQDPVELNYLESYDWPFVKEFLDEVSELEGFE